MDAGLWLTAVGSAAGVAGTLLAAWQVRQHSERRSEQPPGSGETGDAGQTGGLPVGVPFGRLPAKIRGRDALLAELRGVPTRRASVRFPLARRPGRVWVLAGMGGLGKSTIALAAAQAARERGWRVWWATATDTASLTGAMLEVLRQLGAPETVTRPVSSGEPAAADRAWAYLNGPHSAGRRWLLIFDNADDPAVLAAPGATSPADHVGWLRPDPRGIVIVTTRIKDPRTWGPVFRCVSCRPSMTTPPRKSWPTWRLPSATRTASKPASWATAWAACRWRCIWPGPTWRPRSPAGTPSPSTVARSTAWNCPWPWPISATQRPARAPISSGPGTCRLMPWPPTADRRHGRCCSCCRATRPPPPSRSGCCGRTS